MRASTADPGFPEVTMDDGRKVSAYTLSILLNGKRERRVMAFDTAEGWLDQQITPLVIVDGKPQTQRRTGNVSVMLRGGR